MNIRKIATTAVTTTVLSMGIAVPAFAAMSTDYVSGGTWVHGTKDGQIISNFYHGGRYHSSSVKNGSSGTITRSGCTAPARWSYASAGDSWLVDHAYYNFCD